MSVERTVMKEGITRCHDSKDQNIIQLGMCKRFSVLPLFYFMPVML